MSFIKESTWPRLADNNKNMLFFLFLLGMMYVISAIDEWWAYSRPYPYAGHLAVSIIILGLLLHYSLIKSTKVRAVVTTAAIIAAVIALLYAGLEYCIA